MMRLSAPPAPVRTTAHEKLVAATARAGRCAHVDPRTRRDATSSSRPTRAVAVFAVVLAGGVLVAPAAAASRPVELGRLDGGARAGLTRNADGSWGLRIRDAGRASLSQPRPAALELDTGATRIGVGPRTRLRPAAAGYASVRRRDGVVVGRASVPAAKGVRVRFVDRWSVSDGALHVARRTEVDGSARGGFLSALTLASPRPEVRSKLAVLAPATIYGSTRHLAPDGRPGILALGGGKTFAAGFGGIVRIREDRLPAPLYGIRFSDGTTSTLLHRDPDGATDAADGTAADRTLVDGALRFGALGSQPAGKRVALGFWFPGTEGEVSYELRDADAAKRHRWLRREHPLRDGQRQRYDLELRLGRGESFVDLQRNAWRWAVGRLHPRVRTVDQGTVRTAVVGMLRDRIVTTPEGTGIPNDFDAVSGRELFGAFRPALMGFIGKDVENAALLIQDAEQHPSATSAGQRELGERLISSFAARLPMAPPAASGFDLGAPALTSFYPKPDQVFLRQLSDDFNALTRLLLAERAAGREHPEWLAWVRGFADWLLPRQGADGDFPRAWRNGTGEVTDASTSTSDLVVPWLLDLSRLTGEQRYAAAAVKAGEYGARLHAGGQYWGATIDQGDVVAKESAGLALEAALALHRATGERRWLRRATRAAEALQTYVYVWDVPMPSDVPESQLAWKPGVPTIGQSAVATGVRGADGYLLHNVPELVELARLTGDAHWRRLARILLHGNQAMLALPGRTYDLAGPGWQQEFWSFAPPRGTGFILNGIRDWVPWISAVKLRAILLTEQRDPSAFARIAAR